MHCTQHSQRLNESQWVSCAVSWPDVLESTSPRSDDTTESDGPIEPYTSVAALSSLKGLYQLRQDPECLMLSTTHTTMRLVFSILLATLSHLAMTSETSEPTIATDVRWCNDASMDVCIEQYNVVADKMCHQIPDSNAKGDGQSYVFVRTVIPISQLLLTVQATRNQNRRSTLCYIVWWCRVYCSILYKRLWYYVPNRIQIPQRLSGSEIIHALELFSWRREWKAEIQLSIARISTNAPTQSYMRHNSYWLEWLVSKYKVS